MTQDSSEARRIAELYYANRHEEALRRALSLADSGIAPPWLLSLIGAIYFRGRGVKAAPEEGLRWYRRAAEAGDPGALTFLSGFQQDAGRYAEARAMLEDAAAQGYTRARIQLGYMHDQGLGGNRDPRRARAYFEQAASEGYVFAKRLIARQLLRGDDGTVGIVRGALLFVFAVVEGIILIAKDPYSDKAKR